MSGLIAGMRSLGFGLERVVAPIFRWPRLSAVVVLCILALAAYGGTQLTSTRTCAAFSPAGTDAYKDYIQTVENFVDPENEILVLVEGDKLGEPAVFTKLRDFQFELQFIDGVANVVSAFALRLAPDANGDAPLLIDDAASRAHAGASRNASAPIRFSATSCCRPTARR